MAHRLTPRARPGFAFGCSAGGTVSALAQLLRNIQASERALLRARQLQAELAGNVRSLTAAISFDDGEQHDPSEILCAMLEQLKEGTNGAAVRDLFSVSVGNVSVCDACGASYCREDGVEMVLPVPAFKVSARQSPPPHSCSCCTPCPDSALCARSSPSPVRRRTAPSATACKTAWRRAGTGA